RAVRLRSRTADVRGAAGRLAIVALAALWLTFVLRAVTDGGVPSGCAAGRRMYVVRLGGWRLWRWRRCG
ncbi:hypothetical protein CJ430_31460, partial [Klebsiella pneumoniae]